MSKMHQSHTKECNTEDYQCQWSTNWLLKASDFKLMCMYVCTKLLDVVRSSMYYLNCGVAFRSCIQYIL